jgi:hypothetical protein
MTIVTVGLDIAKHVFQAHGVDRAGKLVLRKWLKRAEVASLFAGVGPCVIYVEASGGAHYWFRVLSRLGHTVQGTRVQCHLYDTEDQTIRDSIFELDLSQLLPTYDSRLVPCN